jgi:beta-glucosidase
LQAWYPGQECGNGIADELFGDHNPSGKLPQTFPTRLEDNPAFLNYPGENGKVRYGEGIFVGYRYYQKKKIGPLFPFGFGLSHTRFAYDNLRLSSAEISADERLTASIDVSNVEQRTGQEVVQLYLRDVHSNVIRPEKELKAWSKVALEPGETKRITLELDRESLAFWDEDAQAWLAEAGEFELMVGSSSADIRARSAFVLTESTVFGGSGKSVKRLGLEDSIGKLRENAEAWAVIEKHLPGISDVPELEMALGFTLVQVAGFVPELITQEILDAIAAELA